MRAAPCNDPPRIPVMREEARSDQPKDDVIPDRRARRTAGESRDRREQIGDGTTTQRTTAVDVALPEARVVSAGDRHTCAILHYGGLRCWGYGLAGQLGRGTIANSLTPVTVQY